jgi:hypothetical protein
MTSDSTRHELIDFVISSSCQSRSNQNIKLGGECKTVLSSVDLTGHSAKKKDNFKPLSSDAQLSDCLLPQTGLSLPSRSTIVLEQQPKKY